MAQIKESHVDITLMSINIDEWLDLSHRGNVEIMPNKMTVTAKIVGIITSNIKIKYIPVTSVNEIREEIIKVLDLK